MASVQDHTTVYNEEDIDDEEDEESLDRPRNVVAMDEEDDDEDVEDYSTSSSNLAPPDPLHLSSVSPAPMAPASSGDVTIAVAGVSCDPVHHSLNPNRIDSIAVAASSVSAFEEKKPSAAFDDSRKLFQRLWTDEDEIELLQGFLEYTTHRAAINSSHHHDTTAFYDQIKNKLQLDFNKNQLVEKLRRLKKKYRNIVGKISAGKDFVFKSAHDQATFEISSKIWSNGGSAFRGGSTAAADTGSGGFEDEYANPCPNQNPNISPNPKSNSFEAKTPRPRKRSRAGPPTAALRMDEKQGLISQPSAGVSVAATPTANTNAGAVHQTAPTQTPSSTIEDAVKSCLSPIFRELLNNATCLNGGRWRGIEFGMASSPLGFGAGGSLSSEMMADEKWRKQQMLELEVYSRRLALVQEHIKARLDELRSMGS